MQDEPPSWDEDDDPGLESVSEPDLDEDEALSFEGVAAVTATSRGIGELGDNDIADVDVETATTRAKRAIERDEARVRGMKAEAIAQAEAEAGSSQEEHEAKHKDILDSAVDLARREADQDVSVSNQKDTVTNNSPRPPKPRPLQTLTHADSSVNSQSWIKPLKGGEEAPNGASVL